MKQDKFLTGILIGIGVLVIGAVTMFFVRQSTLTYKTEDSPENVVYNYVLAIEKEDYQKAYGYLKEGEYKPTQTEFRKYFTTGRYQDDAGVQILETDLYEDSSGNEMAAVNLKVSYRGSDPLILSRYSSSDESILIKTAGDWKIEAMPYAYWDWGWYQDFR